MNMNLLKARMIQNNTSAEELSKAIGISKASFYRKISSKTEFTRDEISDISRILSLDASDVMAIFFGNEVS
ncbi:helix-turn-helix domain-containing protein [Galactobacillus timonensis]|uniref:helix-turn-helix domain-containing protein n=1 Tax=Galactobacillus timonensis TaxID=2041840 RepID=UPI000C81FFA8|nr:helix-turn-helix transcriptional regulator [Galactobacillus timonensis]